jgi:hypothetical protein
MAAFAEQQNSISKIALRIATSLPHFVFLSLFHQHPDEQERAKWGYLHTIPLHINR